MVHIIDSVMGSGKSIAATRYIHKHKGENPYIYVTNTLENAADIKKKLQGCYFCAPNIKTCKSKLQSLYYLLMHKHNIIMTHALFSLITPQICELISKYNYVLIMDEVQNIIEEYNMDGQDVKNLLNTYTTIQDNGKLVWNDPSYKGKKFEEEKELIKSGVLLYYSKTTLLKILPVWTFNAFKDVFVLTYMFDASLQRAYYDFYKIKYDYMYITGTKYPEYDFTTDKTKIVKYNFKPLITICENDKRNDIENSLNALSKSWYNKFFTSFYANKLKKQIYNYCHNDIKARCKDIMWTTYKDYAKKLYTSGISKKNFVPCNAKGDNDKGTKTCLCYLINIYANPNITNFFKRNGIEYNSEKYALSEMIQWIWRSAIRNGKHIDIYIPSKRMRYLLWAWLETGCYSALEVDQYYT